MSVDRLRELLSRWEDGSLDSDGRTELEQALATDEALRRALVEADLLATAIGQNLVNEAANEAQHRAPVRRRSTLGAATLVGAAALAALLALVSRPSRTTERPGPVAAVTMPAAQVLVLRGTPRARRDGQARPLTITGALSAGDLLELPPDAEAVITRGAALKVLASGPAAVQVRLPHADDAWLSLDEGTVSVEVTESPPPAAVVLLTPQSRLVIQRASMRLSVNAEVTRLEVSSGSVEVHTSTALSSRALVVRERERISIDAKGIVSRADDDGPARATTPSKPTVQLRASSEWSALRRVPRPIVERLANLRAARARVALAAPTRSACSGGQVGPAQLLIDGALLRDQALRDLGLALVRATVERETAARGDSVQVLCAAHWLGDLAHAALLLKEAGDPEDETIASELTELTRRLARRQAEPARARQAARQFRNTPAYLIAWGSAFALAGQLLHAGDLGALGEPLVAAALAAQRDDGAFVMGPARGSDTTYQGMTLRRLAWWSVRAQGDTSAVDRALARGAGWLAGRVNATGALDLSGDVGTTSRHRNEEVGWALAYDGVLHDRTSLEAAARLLGVSL